MNKQIKRYVLLQLIFVLLLSVLNSYANSLTGKVVDVGKQEITIEIGNSFIFDVGEKIEVSYMAGMLEMLIGQYRVVTVKKDRMSARVIFLDMPPDIGMKVLVSRSREFKEADPGAMLPPSEDPRFLSENMGGNTAIPVYRADAYDGEVTDVTGMDVRILFRPTLEVPVGSSVALIYVTSAGEHLEVGTWKIHTIANSVARASVVNEILTPRKGVKVKIKEPGSNGPKSLDLKKKELPDKEEITDAKAQNDLGWKYQNGTGVEKNYQKAVYWYQKSADQENRAALNNLGVMYMTGKGVKKDPVKAAALYLKSAQKGYTIAQCNIGGCYRQGHGIVKDYQKAFYWYKKAADLGDSCGQNNIGAMYENGTGVPRDRKKALYWFKKADENGSKIARKNFIRLQEDGHTGSKVASQKVSSHGQALFDAVYADDFNLVRQELEKGADVNLRNHTGQTPLHVTENPKIIKLLIAKGADVNAVDDANMSPIFYKPVELSKILVDAGADIHLKSDKGNTPLIFFAYNGYTSGIKYLVSCGALVNIKNADGQTACDVAKNFGHFKLLAYLKSVGGVSGKAVQ